MEDNVSNHGGDASSPTSNVRGNEGLTAAPSGTTIITLTTPGGDTAKESDQLMASSDAAAVDQQMALYEDDETDKPFVSRILHRLANYEGGVVPATTDADHHDDQQVPVDDAPPDDSKTGCCGKGKATPVKKPMKGAKSKLGTVLGVYFPCIQNIFGVILFIRMVWVAGTAGWLEAFIIVFMCCCCTMTTSISLSAIATNGVVSGGGSYFMIGRALGPEFGGAVGLLFYLGTTVASSMYIVGAVEILLQYMAPDSFALFGPINIPSNAYNSYRVYGTALLLFMFTCVFIGVKFVSKFSPFALFCVIGSIVCVYIGIFMANPARGPKVCFVGDRLMRSEKIKNNLTNELDCHPYENGSIWAMFCGRENIDPERDPDCRYLQENPPELKPGIPGLSSGVFFKNVWQHYTSIDNRIGTNEKGDRAKGDIVSDITSSFLVLIGIFFPSVTGIMAGSNRSGDLADPSKSIPIGTIGAVVTTSTVYLSCLLFFAGCVEGQLLRDKFGESIGGGLIVAEMAWPSPWVILIGSFLSTCGAGLQSLVGAPRLLQAIAADGIIPFLSPFAVKSKKGEPIRALLLTATIAECGVLLANVDYIAPIITMFFLMCYCFTNMACAVQTLLRTPNWRPRFRFYHWLLSIFGVILCFALMIMSSWYYTIAAMALAAFIYKYIEYKGAEKEWGDGIRGLSMSAARFALLRLEEGPPHVKNWRPQLLILLKLDANLQPKYRKMLTFATQLKAGKGLTMVVAVLEGDFHSNKDKALTAKSAIDEAMKKEKTKGFSDVVVAKDLAEGLSFLVQSAGLGGMRHNTVLLGWPTKWQQSSKSYKTFLDAVKVCCDKQLALIIAKGIDRFPDSTDGMFGYIDIWWIVHDGGMLMLLPFLLTQHKVWRNCKMRIFTVAQMEDNSIQMKKDLEKFIYHLRLSAEVQVVEMPNADVSLATYERTLLMEQRCAMLRAAVNGEAVMSATPQLLVDSAHGSPAAQSLISGIGYGGGAGGGSSTRATVDSTSSADIDDTHSRDNNVDELVADGDGQHPLKNNDVGARSSVGTASSTTATPRTSGSLHQTNCDKNLYSFSSNTGQQLKQDFLNVTGKPDNRNVRRMHTAVRLNETILSKSKDARLLILNLPGPPKQEAGEENYMEFLEVLTKDFERVLMVRGGGREVITIHS